MMRSKTPLTFALLASTALSGPVVVRAGELPTGGSVAYGAVSIATPSPGAMTIRQSSQAAIVNWQGFSVGQGNSVAIQQPSASAALLNRVTGTTTSTIAGQISANGQVYLVNPNGIVITPTGSVRAGGFVASTLGISDDDFKAGRRSFSGSGQSAAVVNRGAIEIGPGGYAALIGGAVDNAGTISVPLGRVGLGAGERATLDLSGDGFLQVSVPSSGAAGNDALIQSSGKIRAPGGRVEIKAATARDMARNAINLSGTVEARSVGGRSGAIVLGGGAGGRVTVSGRLAATASARPRTASRPPARGGTVTITGQSVSLKGARIDVSGAAGGGTVRIGGDLQGQGTLQRAEQVTIDAATRISANALAAGDGGSVVVWSDRSTSFDGMIAARGGPEGGRGDFAEVSGKEVLAYGGTADLS
ncbi:MAG: filamentous hemagglutinin N-terminal domain-containing protein, partial [Alsobacter sp.]